jgi:hypothetical protein
VLFVIDVMGGDQFQPQNNIRKVIVSVAPKSLDEFTERIVASEIETTK